LTIDEATGVISGTPTAGGEFPVTVRVYNNPYTHSSEKSYTLNVNALAYRPGDLSMDQTLDAVDLNQLIDVVFFNGQPDAPLNSADVNGSCAIDAVDLNYLIDVIFFNGIEPVAGCVE
jgi:hypothetical protein